VVFLYKPPKVNEKEQPMNMKFPHALLMWVRVNKDIIRSTEPPLGMPQELYAQFAEVKLQLGNFERNFRGAKVSLAENCCNAFWHTSSSNLPVRAASAALLCVEHVLQLREYLRGPLWSQFNNFLGLPAPSVTGCASYTMLKEGTLDEMMRGAPEVKLDWGYQSLGLIAGQYPNSVKHTLSLPGFTGKTVEDELKHMQQYRQFVRERLVRTLTQVVEDARRARERSRLASEKAQHARAQQEQEQREAEEIRVEQLARSLHALLSETDRELLLKRTDFFRDVFEKLN
jgi:hypothetical protein